MTARFPAMIAAMRNSIKTGMHSCSVPVNTLCIRVLELLRTQGFIQGFSYLYTQRNPRHTFYHGFPRVTIVFKYTDHNTPILKDINSYKNTRSNYLRLNPKHGNRRIFSDHHMYILSNTDGLRLTFSPNLKESKNGSFTKTVSGKLLAQLRI